MLSLTWVIGVPLTMLFITLATSSDDSPNWRALSWAISTRSTLPGSFQS